MQKLSAPLFQFGERGLLASIDTYTRADEPPPEQLALTGPGPDADRARLPVRGDLAHIKLAGRYFVPHYAVPMPHRARRGGACLRALPATEAAALETLGDGDRFDVLEIAGGWTWGQIAAAAGGEGVVGYILLDELEQTD